MIIRGKVATTIKVVLLALISAVLLTLTQSAFAKKEYVIAAFLAADTDSERLRQKRVCNSGISSCFDICTEFYLL